ncbi:TPA: recombinase family protein [Escherichia coli]|uniref:recombinase family protein n=1 Tax=Escherichia coli TaxID=562 RepID=UPI00092D84CE|nr:recombinase family protein [Escherichia coli]APK44175.1 resolvase [Escherichia coli]EGD4403440.1 recombinase family protein [Escherichia coli]EGX8871946.1 recombinase family protein [Escherichia coli]ELC1606246.1 recombinase family protein [Escherichia coli]ELN4763091.1 recombinase family protein [Escherichia coli]
MRSVITYLRFSSAIQGAEGADSTRRQNDLFKQWLKKNSDAQVVASFSDEGLSGYKGKHLTGQFGDMLARIESGEFPEGTILLVESIDRIGRLEHLETEALMNRILGNGLEIHTLQDGLIYTKDALADDLGISIIQRVKAYIAHQESKQKSFRVSQKWGQRAKLALAGEQRLTRNVPGWIDPDTLKLNEHAETVRLIFKLLLDGESLHNIARHLQSNDIKSFSRRKDANGFSVHSVRTVLRSESVIGTLPASQRNDRPAIPNYYEAAIDASTFNKAQEILDKNRKGRTPASDNPLTINIFKGLFRCQCGASVHPTGTKRTYQGVYRCNNHLDGRCHVPPLKRKPFDKWMLENFLGMIDVGNDGESERKIAALQHEVEIVTSRIKKATALLLEMDDITELKAQVKELNQKRTELQTTIDTLKRKTSLTDKELPQLKDIDLTTKAGRVECQLILSKHLKGLTLGKDSVIVTLQNDTEITIPTNPLPLNDGTSIFEIAEKELLEIDAYQL